MNFGATAGDYYERANDEILVVLQTESPQGVENAEEIYSLPGCDAIFIGPNDLRFQMRADDGTFPTAEEHEAMVQRVVGEQDPASEPVLTPADEEILAAFLRRRSDRTKKEHHDG